ncbi:hypothetical protein C4D60_Mb05t21470 [Musa balbisiana]|uniref:Uncharacterized protein n=1 Tax=Musa balbisiana TaxID=52838 RepID=A0A4S8JXV5_MUSBA|nr:hypothetical protein C4D60_Mb05t21470 [Musa balbisiana]
MVCAEHIGASHSIVLSLAKYPIVISWCWFSGHGMDTSCGVLSGTVDRFKMVFERKMNRRMATLVISFLVLFLLIYYLTK